MRLHGTVLLFVTLTLVAAEKPPAKAPAKAATVKPSRPRGLPADARQVEPLIWEVRHADGTTTRYRETPWGLMELHGGHEGVTARRASDPNPLGMKPSTGAIRVIPQGDSYRFQRDTPFGPIHWTRKKTELNEYERQWVQDAADKNRAGAKPAASQPKKEQAR
jgi:hypothetical protein